MSGIMEFAVTAVAVLNCNAHMCGARWESEVYSPERFDDQERAAAPAFALGWRVYVGERTRHTYCPAHGPKADMRQVLPRIAR